MLACSCCGSCARAVVFRTVGDVEDCLFNGQMVQWYQERKAVFAISGSSYAIMQLT